MEKLVFQELVFLFCMIVGVCAGTSVLHSETIESVPFTQVQLGQGFWQSRLETNRSVTIPYCFKKCEQTGRISNFAKAGGLMPGNFEGIYFNDSDLYKVIEGAAYSLKTHPDAELETYVDGVIDQIAAAQWKDGYLYTFYSLPQRQPEKRWVDTKNKHELYCAGHFFEAAVAYYQATGKRTILDVAIRLADHIDSVFGPGKKIAVPGHQEIEIGLVRLYRITNAKKYLDLAKFFLDMRGRGDLRELYGLYAQDHLPVIQQTEAMGHAVRAVYMYCGMADVAALTGDQAYIDAIDTIWDNVVSKKQYLTGGIGARHEGEAFGENYELPSDTAYNETCAAITAAMWNHRLFLLHGDAKYIDVLERVLYNGFLAGVSLEGNRFFYPNPLACWGGYQRSEWFDCSCCPVNVARFIPSIPNYLYAQSKQGIYLNLFVPGTTQINWNSHPVQITQETTYPWDGLVKINVEPDQPLEFELRVRIPGWARGEVMPGGLYRYASQPAEPFTLTVNGKTVDSLPQQGYAVIRRTWQKGDTILLDLPMKIRRVLAGEKLENNRGRVALERGPLVYCAESVDTIENIRALVLPDEAVLDSRWQAGLLGGVMVLTGTAREIRRGEEGDQLLESQCPFQAIPYYAWAHRGTGQMEVWLARQASAAVPIPAPTLATSSRASASHVWSKDTVEAMHDQLEPANSHDTTQPRHTWWDHKGTREWVQYDFPQPVSVDSVEVYWFDDSGSGACRVPASWRLLYNDGSQWQEVAQPDSYTTTKDQFNQTRFTPVLTGGLRIEAQLQEGFSGGILEWIVHSASAKK